MRDSVWQVLALAGALLIVKAVIWLLTGVWI